MPSWPAAGGGTTGTPTTLPLGRVPRLSGGGGGFHLGAWTLALALPLLLLVPHLALGQQHQPVSSRGCQPIHVPMCKGLLDYETTKLPNILGHRTQSEVYWALQPWWPFIDVGCSNNLRRFLCGLYLPRCVKGGREVHYPCSETCRKAKVRCAKQMRREGMRWAPQFQCSRLLPKSSRRCIRPQRERKKNRNRKFVLCERNKLPMCEGIPFQQGSLPNMFLQGDVSEIEQEMKQFQFLVDSGCSRKLRLFMCGVYMPFCVPGTGGHKDGESDGRDKRDHDHDANAFLMSESDTDVPFVVPCRELCQEVYDQCSGEYKQRTNGLPWPGKFHCHRFPSYVDRYDSSRSSSDSDSNGGNSTSGRRNRTSSSVPCAMPPYNYDGN